MHHLTLKSVQVIFARMDTHDRPVRPAGIRLATAPGSPSQRELVAASLLLCPGKDSGGRRGL